MTGFSLNRDVVSRRGPLLSLCLFFASRERRPLHRASYPPILHPLHKESSMLFSRRQFLKISAGTVAAVAVADKVLA
ncbi:MAG: twin-arginine translocation signal domain-containing protein, partial [Nitrospira sp.]|nr:twin-arginine translocation signal domain-containing protein [Nitrospira sp.]